MFTPLDAADRSPHLSDVVALQFFKDYKPSAQTILWAGKPELRQGYWLRMGLFWSFASGTIITTIYLLTQAQLSTVGWVIVLVISCLVNLFAVLILMGTVTLTKRIQSSFYAFDKDSLFLYNQFQNRFDYYPLAALPDFVTQAHRDGTTTLRGSFRTSTTEKGKKYKTPVLYCLPNGKAVLEVLRQVQGKAKLEAAEKAANPSWLPQD